MKSNNELLVTRVLDANCKIVWDAWTKPLQIAQWFAPGVVMDVREMDVRPGGHFRFAEPGSDEKGEYTGTYITVKPLQEISFNVIDFSQSNDVAGIRAGFKVEFVQLGKQTTMSLTAIPREDSYDKATYDTWIACFDRLAIVVNNGNQAGVAH